MIQLLFVCHGNICRSPMAQYIFAQRAAARGIACVTDSAATSREEIGNPPHHGTVNKLRQERIPLISHRARQMTRRDYDYYDYLIGMDTWNIRNMIRIAGGSDEHNKIYKLMTFAGSERDVADPWYTGDFEATYRDVMEGCTAFLKKLETHIPEAK